MHTLYVLLLLVVVVEFVCGDICMMYVHLSEGMQVSAYVCGF